MAPRAGVAYAEIVPKLADGFSKDLEKQFSKPVEDSGNRVGASLGKVAGLIGGAFAAKGIFDFGKNAIEAATESNKIAAQTEAVIKSTGGAAKTTAAQIGDLASAISNKTGVDDEAIQKGQNLLLTFTNLKNGVGKGNDIFNQATKTMVDMGAALGTDASGAAIQLGKALNDPVKGIAALSRVGVTFTAQQKDQIKAMVAAGDTMGAQKMILKELNTEFGGSAQAQATAGDKLKVVWGNVQEQIGNTLLPMFNKVATFAAENLPAAFDLAGRAFARIREFVQPLIDGFRALWDGIRYGDAVADGFQGAFAAVGNVIHTVVTEIIGGVRAFAAAWKFADGEVTSSGFPGFMERLANLIRLQVIPAFTTAAGFVKDNLAPVLAAVAALVLTQVIPSFVTWAATTWAAVAAQIALALPAIAAAAAIAALAAGVVYAYQHFESFRNIVDGVARFLTDTVVPAVTNFVGYLIGQFSNLVAWVQQYWPQIQEAISHVINFIEGSIRAFVGIVTDLWRQWGDDLLRLAQTAFEFVRGTIDNVLQVIRGIIQTVLALINGDWGKAWDGIKSVLAGIWDQITNTVRTAIDGVKSLLGGVASSAGEAFAAMVEAVVKAILSIPGKLGNIGKDILSKLIPDIPGSGIIEGALKHLPGFGSGGVVRGPIGRPQLAIVHGGEEVITAADRAGGGTPAMHIEQTFNNAKMTPADVSAELAWLRRTSGR